MATDLEGLIARLILLAACAGEEGFSVDDCLIAIFRLLNVPEGELSPSEASAAFLNCDKTTSHAASTVWKWMSERSDISVGGLKKLEFLSLRQVLRLSRRQVELKDEQVAEAWLNSKVRASATTADGAALQENTDSGASIRIYVSEDTMWESITGHGVDYKRLPRLEWVLLQGIASSASNGILQGDLGRLVGQDKRSVPKRTDALVSKGYITKRTTLVRGTKTSKLWLKSLAPSASQNLPCAPEAVTEMTLSRHLLVDSLEAVPWHTRWTNDTIDYTALAATIGALCKEWGVMRLQDLKSKLGVLGMKWQMKVVSKVCRFLSARGAVEYVAAKLHSKIYKDCIRFKRDLSARDWSIFLATGKRNPSWPKVIAHDRADDPVKYSREVRPPATWQNPSLAQCPAWSADIPVSSSIATALRQFNTQGLTNQDICGMTVGQTFTRYISGLTSSLSAKDVQAHHLEYLAVRNEHSRHGKVASYRYFIGPPANIALPEPRQALHDMASHENDRYGFHCHVRNASSEDVLSFSGLCRHGLGQQRKRGRPRKPVAKSGGGSAGREFAGFHPLAESRGADAEFIARRSDATKTTHIPTHRAETASKAEMVAQGSAQCENDIYVSTDTVGAHLSDPNTRAAAEQLSSSITWSRQNRPVGGEQIAGAARNSATNNPLSRPFKCKKCEGRWKNDLGLKYHLEKSKTPCNPSFIPPPLQGANDDTTSKRQGGDQSKRRKLDSFTFEESAPSDHAQGRGGGATKALRRCSAERGTVPIRALRTVPQTPELTSKNPRTSSATVRRSQPGFKPVMMAPNKQNLLLDQEMARARQIAAANITDRSNKSKQIITLEKAPKTTTSMGLTADREVASSSSQYPRPSEHSSAFPLGTARAKSDVPSQPECTISLDDEIENAIKVILEAHGGCVPGGSSLEIVFAEHWRRQFRNQSVPTLRATENVIRYMLRNKLVSEHWHAFRARNGAFAKCQILMSPSQNAFSAEAVQLLERLKNAYPDPLIFGDPFTDPQFASTDKRNGRGRRLLAADLAVLDAPIYKAQVVTKRGANSSIRDGVSAVKRRKTDDDRHPALRVISDAANSIRFLPENSVLSADPASTLDICSLFGTGVAVQVDCREMQSSLREPESPRGSISRDIPDAFLCMELTDALPQRGWLSDSTWYSWVASYVATAAKQPANLLEQSKLGYFMETLQLCAKLEHESHFLLASSSSQVSLSHKAFISFAGGTDRTAYPALIWSNDNDQGGNVAGRLLSGHDDEDSGFLTEAEEDLAYPKETLPAGQRITSNAESAEALTKRKRVALTKRQLTNLPHGAEQKNAEHVLDTPSSTPDAGELMAAFIAVRVLLGGVEKTVDWGHLLSLFPELGLHQLRRFWIRAKKDKAAYISKFTEDFQDRLLSALSSSELPMIDFDNIENYDWKRLIRWTMRISNQDRLQMPSSRQDFREGFSIADGGVAAEDWREKFYHSQSSVFARFEVATLEAGALPLPEDTPNYQPLLRDGHIAIARSWVRSLCCTGESKYSPQDIKMKFASLSSESLESRSSSLRRAVDALTKERVICKSKKTPLGGRPYRLNESFITVMAKYSNREKFRDAAAFKLKLDLAFQDSGMSRLPYTLEDGAVMALTNLCASRMVVVKTVKVPKIPFGFEPGNYESRKYPKSYYHLALQIESTNSYEFTDDIDVLKSAKEIGIPSTGPLHEIPQWVDFFGELDADRWADLLGAVCFVINTRGSMPIKCICASVAPALEFFEARLIAEWGLSSGVFSLCKSSNNICLGEWWWLAVDQQRQTGTKS